MKQMKSMKQMQPIKQDKRMKKLEIVIIIVIAGILFTLFMSRTKNSIVNGAIAEFSYEADKTTFASEEYQVVEEGFINNMPSEVKRVPDVIDLAKNEVSISYDHASIFCDRDTRMWLVLFESSEGETQRVYLNEEGKTTLIVYGKNKE